MRKIAAFLLLTVVLASAQTATDKCTKHIFEQLDELDRSIELNKQIKNEFADMSLELARLGNEQVNGIMRPHILKIKQMQTELQKNK